MLQKKLIRPGEGARITTQVYRGGWRGYQGHTLVVRLPNSRSDTFRVADVVTEGIQGQPQLTFDSRDAAIAWKESHPQYSDWSIGRVNREYMCIKIPLEDGSEAWLAESNFPDEGSPEWDRLRRLYPDYFRVGPGFFTEEIYTRPNLHLEVGYDFLTNKSDVIMKLNQAGAHFWLAEYTRYEITEILEIEEGVSLCCGNYYSIDEDDETTYWKGSWDEHDNITLSDMEQQINIPGAILEFNGLPVENKHLGFFEQFEVQHVSPDSVYKVADGSSRAIALLPTRTNRRDTFDLSWENTMLTQYRDLLFKTREEAERFVHDNTENGRVIKSQSYWTGELIRIPLNRYDDYEIYLSPTCFPRYPEINERFGNSQYQWSDESCNEWWHKLERFYPEHFGREPLRRLGFFSENLNLTESYDVPHDTIKKVVIKYVKENGYIRGDWNGRYPTESPTVYEINKLLRYEDDLEPYECTPEQFEQMNTWVSHVQPEGPQADWMRSCIESWNKQSDLNKDDLKNMVSFVSYKFSNDAYNRRQELKRQRDLEHQQHVESERNTWAGEIGDKISFVVQEPKSFGTAYGTMWNCIGTDGRTYTFGYQEEVQRGYTVSGKVTKLNEFRGIKQTHLTRVNVDPTHLGFF